MMNIYVGIAVVFAVFNNTSCFKLNFHHQAFIGDESVITLDSEKRDLIETEYEEKKNFHSFEVLASNVTIPDEETTYWCSVHKLPAFERRVHGVGFEGVISKLSKGLVHHIEVFGCDIKDEIIPPYSGKCGSANQPIKLSRCRHVLAAWAFGAKALFYPKETGLTFYSSIKSPYVRLEIHYNNQNKRKGIVDTSGIRFFYSPILRRYEVGVLETGVIYTPDMVIPPNQSTFNWVGVCPAMCTQKALPSSGINIFAGQLHAHLNGRKIVTSQFRDGIELSTIRKDFHYSTWNEQIVKVQPVKKIMPGDDLITTCQFSTRNKTTITFGGLGLDGEMCVAYLHYYPASELEVCKSAVSKNSLNAFFALQSVLQRKTSLIKSYNEMEWSHLSIAQLNFLYHFAPLQVHCLKPNGEPWSGKWDAVPHIN